GAGGPVAQGDAVQQERRGERAQQEVLHGRLLGGQAAGLAGQHVQAERQDLQGDEHHQQVGGGGQQHHAEQGEQQQRVHLGRAVVRLPFPAVALGDHQGGQDAGGQQHRPGVAGDAVQRHRALEGDPLQVPVPGGGGGGE